MLPWNKKINFNFEDIEDNLIKNASSSKELSDEDKYYQALEEINKAAEIFEGTGLVRVASLLGDILNKLSKAEDFEKYVENQKNKGWMFNDSNDENDLNIGEEYRPIEKNILDIINEQGLSPLDELELQESAGLNPIEVTDEGDEDFEDTDY